MSVKSPRWAAAITGPRQDIAQLAEHLPGPVRIYRGDEGWELTDDRWDSLEQLVAVHAAVEQLTTHLRALARLHLGRSQPIRYTGNIFERVGRNRHKHVLAGAEGRARAERPASPTSWSVALDLARRDPAVGRAWDFLSVEPNWHTLRAALDPVRRDDRAGGTAGIARNGWATESELDRFEKTAQSYEAVGIVTSHGDDTSAPDIAMTLSDAEELVARIVAAWIDRLAQDDHQT